MGKIFATFLFIMPIGAFASVNQDELSSEVRLSPTTKEVASKMSEIQGRRLDHQELAKIIQLEKTAMALTRTASLYDIGDGFQWAPLVCVGYEWAIFVNVAKMKCYGTQDEQWRTVKMSAAGLGLGVVAGANLIVVRVKPGQSIVSNYFGGHGLLAVVGGLNASIFCQMNDDHHTGECDEAIMGSAAYLLGAQAGLAAELSGGNLCISPSEEEMANGLKDPCRDGSDDWRSVKPKWED